MIYNINDIKNNVDELQNLLEYAIYIPKEYARGETNVKVKHGEEQNVPHYEIRVERQIGSTKNRRDTYLFLKLPKSEKYVSIILHMDGGVSFNPRERKFVLRELDELDRRIILGFCMQNETSLHASCYDDKEFYNDSLQMRARDYRHDMMPKRLKIGSHGNDFTKAYGHFKPYEKFGLFSEVQFI